MSMIVNGLRCPQCGLTEDTVVYRRSAGLPVCPDCGAARVTWWGHGKAPGVTGTLITDLGDGTILHGKEEHERYLAQQSAEHGRPMTFVKETRAEMKRRHEEIKARQAALRTWDPTETRARHDAAMAIRAEEDRKAQTRDENAATAHKRANERIAKEVQNA